MKKYLIAVALIVPFLVSAETTSSTVDLQTVIEKLQTQVADLQTEVQSLKIELKLSRALTQGAKGDDVKQLQEFLRTFTGAYPEGLVTGYYGPNTKAAVKKFQEQNGIEPLGIVGPKTREKLNVLAAAIPATSEAAPVQHNIQTTTTAIMPATSQSETEIQIPATGPAAQATPCKVQSGAQIQPASVKVLSPNGSEEWQIGGTHTIKYTAKDSVGNKALLIYLEKGYDAPSTKTGANSRLLIGA
ncbi:MAG: peptidoglycan-binding domain-containing protein, partial [Minisyncoccia bacterium]